MFIHHRSGFAVLVALIVAALFARFAGELRPTLHAKPAPQEVARERDAALAGTRPARELSGV